MFNTELDTVRKYNMLKKGDKIIIALSGGCDSVYLLYFLLSVREEFDLSLYACHLNHSIRENEADRDMLFSKKLAEDNSITFFCETVDVPKMAKESSLSVEEAGRNARYSFFERISKEVGGAKIATAHHLDDNAETVLMHIIRGCGINGLSGIAPVRDNIIRPLIDTKKEDIISYLDQNSLNYVTDSTNLENDYLRNSIRNELLPFIKEKYNPNIASGLNNLSHIAAASIDYTNNSLAEKINIAIDDNGVYCEIKDICSLDRMVCANVFKRMAQMLGFGSYDLLFSHYESIYNLCINASCGKKVPLPFGACAKIVYDRLYFTPDNDVPDFEYTFSSGESFNIKETGISVITEYTDYDGEKDCLYLEVDKNAVLTIRNRRSGDSFIPSGMKGHKKLKNYFIDMKIPQFERGRVPVIAYDGTIIAVGTRAADGYEAKKKENDILKIKFIKTRD